MRQDDDGRKVSRKAAESRRGNDKRYDGCEVTKLVPRWSQRDVFAARNKNEKLRSPEHFVKCAVSPRAAKQMTQGKIALSRRQHQLRPRIARPTRRGSPFSANVKKLTMSVYRFFLSLYLSFSLLLATPVTNPPCLADPATLTHIYTDLHVNLLGGSPVILLDSTRNRTGCQGLQEVRLNDFTGEERVLKMCAAMPVSDYALKIDISD